MILNAQGLYCLKEHTAKFGQEKIFFNILIGYCVLLGIGIWINHPYEYSFYNVLAGNHVEEKYELDYWDMSFKQAYEHILNEDSQEEISVSTITNPEYWGLEAQLYAIRGRQRMRIRLCKEWREAEYLIINPTYANMYGAEEYIYIQQNYTLVDTMRSYGSKICEIYKLP